MAILVWKIKWKRFRKHISNEEDKEILKIHGSLIGSKKLYYKENSDEKEIKFYSFIKLSFVIWYHLFILFGKFLKKVILNTSFNDPDKNSINNISRQFQSTIELLYCGKEYNSKGRFLDQSRKVLKFSKDENKEIKEILEKVVSTKGKAFKKKCLLFLFNPFNIF